MAVPAAKISITSLPSVRAFIITCVSSQSDKFESTSSPFDRAWMIRARLLILLDAGSWIVAFICEGAEDEKYFGGTLKDIRSARPHVQLPILRKDFIIDEYQLYQARIVGADAILLIAAALKKEQCKALAVKAHELELEVLLEIHNEQELEYVNENIDMVGVNNRNLGTFHTDVENSFRLAEKLPKEMLWVSESGISSPETVKQLRAAGFRGFLIGENFMKTPEPGEALKEFITQLEVC